MLWESANKIVVEYAMSRTMSPVMVAQYKRQFIPKEVLQRTFEEYLALPETIRRRSNVCVVLRAKLLLVEGDAK